MIRFLALLILGVAIGCGGNTESSSSLPADAGNEAPAIDTISCGAMSCTGTAPTRIDPGGTTASLSPCCASVDRCGVDLSNYGYGPLPTGCVDAHGEGVIDPSCSSFSVSWPHGAGELDGCRRPDGSCGVMIGKGLDFDLGCQDFGGVPGYGE